MGVVYDPEVQSCIFSDRVLDTSGEMVGTTTTQCV